MRRAWLAAVLLLAACEGESRLEIADRRVVAEPRQIIEAGAEQRFRVAEMFDQQGGQPPPPPAPPTRQSGLGYDVPAGWEELPPTEMRQINLRLPEDASCWVTALPGGGGGLLANVNRWRNQLGAAPLDQAGVAALPRVALLGQQAVWFELEGAFAEPDQAPRPTRFLGLLLEQEGGLITVKLVGPPAAVEKQRDALLRFAASLRLEGR